MSDLYALYKAIELAPLAVLMPGPVLQKKLDGLLALHTPLTRGSVEAMEQLPEEYTAMLQTIEGHLNTNLDSFLDHHEFGTVLWAEHVLTDVMYHLDQPVHA